MRTHRTLLPAAALIAGLALTACGASTAAAPAAHTAAAQAAEAPQFSHPGDVVHFDGGISTGTITLVSVHRQTVDLTPEQKQIRGESGSYLVAEILVQVEQVRDGSTLLVSGGDFSAQDPDGTERPATFTPFWRSPPSSASRSGPAPRAR